VTARLTVGLTGDVGAGKSTVREWLVEHGAVALDADAVIHDLLAGDQALVGNIAARFGPEVRREGGVDRGALAEIVFADPAALQDLERLLHPAVLSVASDWLAGVTSDLAVVEAVKLVESGLYRDLDRLWLVICATEIREQRLVERGWSQAAISRRMAAAPPLAPQLAVTDVVIDNSGSRQATARQLEVALVGLGLS
jgi:dephospho-CoA kinase